MGVGRTKSTLGIKMPLFCIHPVKCRFLNFFCLYTTKIIIKKIFIFFICPSSKKLFLDRNNIGGAFAPVYHASYTYELDNISPAMMFQKHIAVSCGIRCPTVQNELRYFQHLSQLQIQNDPSLKCEMTRLDAGKKKHHKIKSTRYHILLHLY